VSGAAGSNECPAGSVRIVTEAACRTAAAAAGKPVPSSETFSYLPRGCYHGASDNIVAFNTHAVGAATPHYRLLCAAVTTGAPRPELMFARTYTGTGSGIARVSLALWRCGSVVLCRHVVGAGAKYTRVFAGTRRVLTGLSGTHKVRASTLRVLTRVLTWCS
jgi:hypothetical protein